MGDVLADLIGEKLAKASSLPEIAAGLEHLLSDGYSVLPSGELYNIRQQVARVNGLRIEVFAREHGPPHFHVTGGGVDAKFRVADGAHLEGQIGGREKALVGWWYARSRPLLVRTWNETRPSDCPVGPIEL